MAEPETENTTQDAAPAEGLESSTYEIIRSRLSKGGKDLRSRLEKLNEARKAVFGSIETTLLGTERITTVHNCIPRDMVSVGNRFLFGYNVHLGLKSETVLSDVFSVYKFEDQKFHEQTLELINDTKFEKDFADLFRYYKDASFAKFAVRGPHLFAVFRIGKSVTDIKTFKWVIDGDALRYIDNRSDHEMQFPPQHEFEWKRTHRELHQSGLHPHISIENRVFVETVGGDLTIKIENNTETGEGIYSEEVDNKDQSLDDAEIYYATVGNVILLKIKPYQERDFRYIVYNEKTKQARRMDSVKDACVLLPDDHGLIFANGYYLQDGEHKTFENSLRDMLFERRLTAPNGEDYLYVFYNRDSGVYALLQYNLIEQRVETPIICNGSTFFEGGELVCFKAQGDAQKHHTIQFWQTPYVDEDYVPHTQDDSFLNKIGNKDIVRGMAECHEILNLINKEDTYSNLYDDLVKRTNDIVDAFFWIDKEETFDLATALTAINGAATAAVDEFEKVVRVKQGTAEQTRQAVSRTKEILSAIQHKRFDHINDFVTSLADLRAVRGDIISLRDLRYVDLGLVEKLETDVSEQAERLSRHCVNFLLEPKSLAPYEETVSTQKSSIDDLTKVADARQLEEEIAASAGELEMLIEIVSNLKIDDATQRTTIIDSISSIFSTVNQARAMLKKKIKELASVEGVAEFNSQIKLLNQGVVNYLDICDTPEKCEEFLTKVMIQLEELEGRFAEFDEFIQQLTEKREEVYNAFESRKLALVESRNKRANTLKNAADRILKGIQSRVQSFDSINDINGYFASDLMIEKVRDIVEKLKELDDSVKVDDIQSRMKTIREDAVRQLKDRQELFVEGENIIRFGTHLFTVNVQALDLTTVMQDGHLCLHLTGTNFFEPIVDEKLLATRNVWDQEVPSENREVYRGEYLAFQMLQALDSADNPTSEELLKQSEKERLAYVQRFMGPRYSEAYTKGVNDVDAANILQAVVQMNQSIGLLRFHTRARALAGLFWHSFVDRKAKTLLQAKLQGVGAINTLFPETTKQSSYIQELAELVGEFASDSQLFPLSFTDEAAEYLYFELISDGKFVCSRTAANLYDGFHEHLRRNDFEEAFTESIKTVHRDPASCFVLLKNWIQAYVAGTTNVSDDEFIDEVALFLMHGKLDRKRIVDGSVKQKLTGFVGSHAVIDGGSYDLNYNQFMQRLNQFEKVVVPRFQDYVDLKHQVVDDARGEMRLDEFRPRVLTSFVRNKLLNDVYLPLIGDNLAKQIGVAGEQKRTDLMGLLLLVSPPGYGKTTLMEYIANRLGLIFMKINGPAIGHQVTSLDPTEASNAGAREEVAKLNLALEMGDNVMIYVDDIQHTNPEFLQKFISLCDAQRKIEGVYKGKTRTYDLRGRKVAVVMAGNPYTESGEKFQIPDMLSNRADIYNLGEIIGESRDAFEMSYLENSLTSNPVLSKLATHSQKDVYGIFEMAKNDSREGIDLEGSYSLEELNELINTIQKLMRVRDVILAVNQEYIRSAAQSDDYRTEPAFKLQGSYRNMNRIAEKVLPIMNDDELTALIVANYENDAQTLTSGTEANLLKFKELMGNLTDEESQRWEDIKRTFKQNVKMRGIDAGDKVGQVIVQLSSFSDGLDAIRKAMSSGVELLSQKGDDPSTLDDHVATLVTQFSGLRESLESVGETVSTGLVQFAETAIQKESAAPVAAPAAVSPQPLDAQKITIVNKIPKSLLSVLEQQFKLMHAWMEPIFKATDTQSADIQELKTALDQCMSQYVALIERVDGVSKD